MPSNVQIFTPSQIRDASAIDSNVYDDDIAVSAKWVQDSSVEQILGTALFNKIINIVETDSFDDPDNAPYKYIRDEYLLFIVGWGVRADVQPQLHNKVRNAGTVRSTDEHVDAVDMDDMYRNINRYERRRDSYMQKLSDYLRCHLSDFPEYQLCGCNGCENSSPKESMFPFGIYVD